MFTGDCPLLIYAIYLVNLSKLALLEFLSVNNNLVFTFIFFSRMNISVSTLFWVDVLVLLGTDFKEWFLAYLDFIDGVSYFISLDSWQLDNFNSLLI